ncbi:hypothetical protein ABZ635_07225 [Nocardiopsis sp. NPDC007018]|uniref:hypothetical protein n=1 Tax=Nocardiopsis sp. NPDC007018 TaxID=3155721 RepID=UPI0033FB0FAB
MSNKRNREKPDHPPTPAALPLDEVVKAYAAQAKAADQLADVDTTHLETPTVNPNVVGVLNAERDHTARERIRLDYQRERMSDAADHERLVDRHRAERRRAGAVDARADRAVNEGLADADEAAAELTEVRAFEQSTSPATATRRLTVAARGWRREEFAYAIAGSALSAVGMAAMIMAAASVPALAAGAIAIALEIVLTVRVIRLIGQRAELAEQHKGQNLSAGGAKALRFLTRQIIALLAVSVLLNLAGLVFFNTSVLGALGALGAGAAALASWSAWQASVAATETVRSNVKAWQGENWSAAREELRVRAGGAHIPVPDQLIEQPSTATVVDVDMVRQVLAGMAEEHLAALADRGTDALAVMLKTRSGEGGTPTGTGGGTPPGTPLEPQAEPASDRQVEVEPEDHREAVLAAITDPETGLGAGANNSEIGRRVGLSRTAVRKHRVALAAEGHQVFQPETESE